MNYHSNSKLGKAFEKEFCDVLYDNGYWVHFVERKSSGAQPFDIIAAKNNEIFVFDAKTNSGNRFVLSRIEENQIESMSLYNDRGNKKSFIVIKKDDTDIYVIPSLEIINKIKDGCKSVSLSNYDHYKIKENKELRL